jgi:hypothetical protein
VKDFNPVQAALQLFCLLVLLTPVGAIMVRYAGTTLWVGRAILLTSALSFSAGTIYLFSVGNKAGWTSDGPGALGIMLAVLVLGSGALFSGGMLFTSFGSRLPAEER